LKASTAIVAGAREFMGNDIEEDRERKQWKKELTKDALSKHSKNKREREDKEKLT